WITAYYGIIRTGAVAVPLEYEFLDSSPELVLYALRHSESRGVIVKSDDRDKVADLVSDLRIRLLTAENISRTDCSAETVSPDPEEPAQILYTSGTTGRKKGVVLTHHNVLANVAACCQRFKVHPSDCLPAILPHHHAYPLTTTVILPFYAGARMAVGDVKNRRTSDFIRSIKPTVFVGVPRVFEALLSGIETAAAREDALKKLRKTENLSGTIKKWTGVNIGPILFRTLHKKLFGGAQLRFCVSGGARLDPQLLRRYLRLGIPLVQGWGMTELSPVGTVQKFSRWRFLFTRHYEKLAGAIGLPLKNTEIYLADVPEQDVIVDRDKQGEMLIKGPQVMKSYYKDPDETARAKSPAGLRSGDIARRDSAGRYRIVGRSKHVIVLPGGKKVFPEEDLAPALAACPTIDEFTVRAIQNRDGEEQIGVIIKPDEETIARRKIRTHGQLYENLKSELNAALENKPGYLRRFDFCVTELEDGEFRELDKNSMKDPSPLKNEFRFEYAWSTRDERDAEREITLSQPERTEGDL
ncbi:MAG: AMP-binding protein, partial [Planctomycetes bacterium]|nr:AMP-binding protein [Planctomycetota bacterium]